MVRSYSLKMKKNNRGEMLRLMPMRSNCIAHDSNELMLPSSQFGSNINMSAEEELSLTKISEEMRHCAALSTPRRLAVWWLAVWRLLLGRILRLA